MKKNAFFLAFLLFAVFFSGCGQNRDSFDINKVYYYRNIPGVTQDEIDAVEALKKAGRTLSFGHYNTTGAFQQVNNVYAGFQIKLCRHFSTLFGIYIVPQPFEEWDYLLTAIDDHTVDFMGDLTPTTERMSQYYMTQPIADTAQRVFLLVDNRDIVTETDLTSKTIGFYTGAANADILLQKYPHITFTSIYIDTAAEAADMLTNGKIDAFIADSTIDPAFAGYDFIQSKEMFPLAFMPLSVATANPEMQPIISIIDKYIDAGGIDKIYSLFHEGEKEYAKYKLNNQFTEEEKTYLANLKENHTSISVAMLSNNYPISFYNNQEHAFQGIAIDVLDEISSLTGIHFASSSETETPWHEIYGLLTTSQIPMTSFMMRSESFNDQTLWSDTPYTRTHFALLSKVEKPRLSNYQVLRSTVGVVRDSVFQDLFTDIFPAHENVIYYEQSNDVLDALEKDEVDLMMASDYILLMQANYREKSGYKVNYRFNGIPLDVYFGFSKDEAVLCSIVSKAQAFVNTEDITVQWTSRTYDYSRTIASQRTIILIVSVSVLIVLLLYVFILLLRNKRSNKSLQQKAYTDALTGIFNRRHFMEMAAQQMEQAAQTNGESFIIIFDLDHFKSVNDTYGHLVGDKVLQGVAHNVKETIRPYDLFGRYGGEEFILYIANVNKTAIRNLAERIRLSIANNPIECGEVQIPMTASFGIACATPVNNLDKATRIADDALYKAKNAGRNRVMFGEK